MTFTAALLAILLRCSSATESTSGVVLVEEVDYRGCASAAMPTKNECETFANTQGGVWQDTNFTSSSSKIFPRGCVILEKNRSVR